ncbi:hypothetical protein E9O_01957 [Moraxella catarrhalis 12P80B1]|nr:hypothetical protein E9O_01957 [Moraxella catarrhalis 12P80B1]EGE24338.1 hypothetical protein E9Y_05492 [Moraxella catarrhalis 101P30B1]EGE26332.1 hypothetical protein EA1_05687 [Moraxella catarrhalis O35E]
MVNGEKIHDLNAQHNLITKIAQIKNESLSLLN